MPLSVSSWFLDECYARNATPARQFTIGGSDYSERVLRWPSFTQQWDDLRPTTVTLQLANDDQAMNFFLDDKTNIRQTCELNLGLRRWGGLVNPATAPGEDDGYVAYPTSGSAAYYLTDSSYAFEAWFKPTSDNPGVLGYFVGRFGFHNGLYISNRRFSGTHWYTDSTNASVFDSTSVELNTDHHLLLVRDKPNLFLALYRNGDLVGSTATSSLNRAMRESQAGYFFHAGINSKFQAFGIVDECRIYNFAPTPAQARRFFRGDYSTLQSGQLQLYYGFDEISSAALTNSGFGSISSGQYVGTPTFVERQQDERRGPGSPEYVSLFQGDVTRVEYAKGACTLTMADKVNQLAERVVGTDPNTPVTFAAQIPSDIFWTLCTCYGALDGTANSSNPDIDYPAWQDWAAVWSADSVQMAGHFKGKKVLEALRSMARHTRSAIYMKENRLSVARFSNINTQITSLSADDYTAVSVSIEEADIINKQYVFGLYDPTSKDWTLSVWQAKSASINSYGLHENVEKDESIWYVTSQDAVTLAQRIMFEAGEPYERVNVDALLQPLPVLIGETLIAADPHTGISNGWRVMARSINMDNGTTKLQIDGSQIVTPFLLDISALDGGDLLL